MIFCLVWDFAAKAGHFRLIPTRKDCWIALCGQIDVENPKKLTPLNGVSLFSKKKKKRCMERYVSDYYFMLFNLAYVSREMGSNKEIKLKWFQWRLWLMFRVILLCSLACKCASGRRALYKWFGCGKFWSLHNPQKLCMCQISWFSRRLFMLTQTL